MSIALTVVALHKYHFVCGLYCGQRLKTSWALWSLMVSGFILCSCSVVFAMTLVKGIYVLEAGNPSNDYTNSMTIFLDNMKPYTRMTLFAWMVINFGFKIFNSIFIALQGKNQYKILSNDIYRIVDNYRAISVLFVFSIFVLDLLFTLVHYRLTNANQFIVSLMMMIHTNSSYWISIYFLMVNICLFHRLKIASGKCTRLDTLLRCFKVAQRAAHNARRFYTFYRWPLMLIVARNLIGGVFIIFFVCLQGRNTIFLPNIWLDCVVIGGTHGLLYLLGELLCRATQAFYLIANKKFDRLTTPRHRQVLAHRQALITKLLHQDDHHLVAPPRIAHLSQITMARLIASSIYIFDVSVLLYQTEFMTN